MHVHILGICGTFMAGLALLARGLGHRVTGSDEKVYPPMSELLRAEGIEIRDGYDPLTLEGRPDCMVVGNALTRGNPMVEHLLDHDIEMFSGPQWLATHVLRGRKVIAVAGTHGKTTTTSMLAWILSAENLEPGFLVGGVPLDFGVSARLGAVHAPFVVEADEYDCAFFDKRSKFVHYRPGTLIINNIEFDHADIFDDLAAIRRQFHHLVRTLPRHGLILRPQPDAEIDAVLALGCWTAVENLHCDADAEATSGWRAGQIAPDGSAFDVVHDGSRVGRVEWDLIGRHNVMNGLAAIAAACDAGVSAANAAIALSRFKGVRRRMEQRGCVGDVRVYDDFAHHPTAVATTLAGLRSRVGEARILAILDPASNTMRMGVHRETLGGSLRDADHTWIYASTRMQWDPREIAMAGTANLQVCSAVDDIVAQCADHARPGDHVLVMSNGGFEGLHEKLLNALREKRAG